MTATQRRYSKAALIACTLLASVIMVGRLTMRAWDWGHGNTEFDFYGQIIDESGQPLRGVTVDAELLYSDGWVRPQMFGRPEVVQPLTALTDENGCYEFTGLTGYSISLRGVHLAGFRFVDASPPPYRPSTWTWDRADSWKTLPSSRNRRDICRYKLVPAGSVR